MHRLTAWALVALVAAVQFGCSKERVGRARITGYLFDGETGQAIEGVNIKTFEAGNEVKATTKGGFFNLEGLSASGQYRVTAAKDGYATRFFNVTIAQVPTDAYDAVPLASVGSVAMPALKGTVKGRVEFLNAASAPLAIGGASVIMDLVNNGSFDLVKTATTGANGEFSIDGLPSLPTGLNLSICVITQPDARYGAVEFAPLCTNLNVYSGQANFITLRPSRTDTSVGDVNFYQGTVRDAITRLPIQGVSVYEVGKDSEATTTDANGYYFLRTTSVNKYAQVVFKKENYAEGLQEYNVLGRGGTQSRDLNLAPGGASIVGRILYANSQPANNAEIRLDMRGAGYNVFKLVKTNATGDFTIDNLPGLPDGLSVTMVATPWSADPDLFPETAPQNITVSLYPGAPTPVLRQLSSNAALSLIAYNFYTQFIDTAEPVRLLLSLPTVPNENQFTLTDANSGQPMPYTIAYSDSNRRITVTPSVASGQPLWSEARVYNIRIRLRANNGPNGILDQTFSFTPRSSLANANISSPITSLIVDTPDIDANSRTLNFRWPPLKDAFSYSLYVRTSNTARLPSYVRLGNVGATANPQLGINLGSYNFTSALEPISGQPFAFGQVLGFLVVPVDSRGIETDATKGATLELKDVVPPRWEMGIAQLDNGAGGTGVRFVMRATEAMDRTTAPTVTLPAGLTAGTWSVDESQNGVEGTLRTTGSISGSSTITVQLRDTSGNLSAPLSVPVFANALIPNHGFEAASNMCTSAAWTAAANTTCGGCPNQTLGTQPAAALAIAGSKSAYEGVCALSFGDLDAMYCGVQQIEAPMDLTTLSTNRNVYFAMRSWSYYSSGSLTLTASLLNIANTVISNPIGVNAVNSQRTWVNSVAEITGVVPVTTRLRLTANAGSCGTRAGFQVDDLRVFIH